MINWVEVTQIRRDIDRLWQQEEQYWGQRSRVKWMNYGDRNSKFFHASTIQRRDLNKLLRIKDADDNWLEGQTEVMNGISNYYNNLYSYELSTCTDQCLEVVHRCISNSMNRSLTSPVLMKEVETAVFSLGAYKALGPDGL